MRNYLQDGERMTVVAPANVNSGDVVAVGQIVGVAITSAASAANVAIRCGGVFALRKLNGASTSYAQGANLYWDATNANVTISANANTRIGVATIAGANADTVATVRLNPSF
jgi:predicted RecA/RadA family phage recombinase